MFILESHNIVLVIQEAQNYIVLQQSLSEYWDRITKVSKVDCEECLFCSKTPGQEKKLERKTSERASLTASVTCERRATKPLAASSAGVGRE